MSIFFAKPVGDIEAMLRELAPPPHEHDFNLDPCVRGHDHCFVLNTGELSGALVASWALRCTGLWDTLGDANNLLLPVHELGQCRALPEMAAEKMAKKLEDIKDWLQDMVPDLVPPNPEVLETPVGNNRRKRDLQSKFPLHEESPVFSLNSDERDREIHTDGYYPDQDDLDILLPSAVTTKLLVYTITNNWGEYIPVEPVDEPANLVAHGNIWEQRVRDWADEQAAALATQTAPSSKRSIDRGSDASMSAKKQKVEAAPLIAQTSGSGSTPADAEAASAEVVVHASGSHGRPTHHMGREPGPPTTAEPANAALTKEELYQQKIHAYGYFYQAPLSVSTSDPDYSDAGSSDIEHSVSTLSRCLPSMATSTTDPTGVSLDLTRNRDVHGPLGPFDSKVTALVHVDGESYFIVTNANYIPALPIKKAQTIFLREDMRYGEDDPTFWPQNYSAIFCHLGAIQRKPVGDKRAISIMWWNPTPNDFVCHDSGLTGSRGLGRLIWDKISQLSAPMKQFMDDYKTARPQLTRVHEMLDALVQQLRLGLERLEMLPSTYTQMQVAVTALQQTFLEADGLFRYMTVYKPRMDIAPNGPPPTTDHCVGVFTTQPVIAQQFRAAGLPYWFLVELREPAHSLVLESAPGATHIRTKPDMDSKITTIHRCSCFVPWYKDPFASSVEEEPDSIASSIDEPSSSRPASTPQESRRYQPYPSLASNSHGARGAHSRGGARGGRGGRGGGGGRGRDKFLLLERDEMPPSIPAWEDGLKGVDRMIPPRARDRGEDGRYVLPEPALVVSSEDPGRPQLYLHHLSMMMDALIYCLADPDDAHHLLSSQQWRDLLLGGGTADGQARTADENSRAQCGDQRGLGGGLLRLQLDSWCRFPSPPRFLPFDHQPPCTGVACRECFAGGMLMGMPVELAKQGLASMSPRARLPFIKSIAKLMRKWEPRPESAAIAQAQDRQEWDDAAMGEVEAAVAKYYTQTFYEYFGRATVVPMCLVHEFGT
ncbi:hypothetical protein K438DRAFT_1788235 [Mycena galopus ATCC 62051]|nr:hypothetical protein K438DRAFT_1788235 [Mycena galopus ATCC 62051]